MFKHNAKTINSAWYAPPTMWDERTEGLTSVIQKCNKFVTPKKSLELCICNL